MTLRTPAQVYRKTPAKLHKLLPALATQAAHASTVDAFNHLKHEVRSFVCVLLGECARVPFCACAEASRERRRRRGRRR